MEATVGIDISKRTFSACILSGAGQPVRDFSNDRKGFSSLQAWLRELKISSARVCMESTNRYWEALAKFLFAKQHRVSVVNAYRTASYWKSEHLRAKTDHIDAAMLARFCIAQNPPLWQPPRKELQELRDLVRELEFLKLEQTRFRVRSEHGDGYCLNRLRAALKTEIKKLQIAIVRKVRGDSEFSRQFTNLLTVPGIGKVTAFIMMSELGDKVHVLDRDELVAYTGLAPRIFESGTSIRKSKGTMNAGNHRVKRAFYLPALAAIRVSPYWRSLYSRLVERGKPKKLAIGAVMRKLFIAACGVLKSNTVYDVSRRPAAA